MAPVPSPLFEFETEAPSVLLSEADAVEVVEVEEDVAEVADADAEAGEVELPVVSYLMFHPDKAIAPTVEGAVKVVVKVV